MVSVGWYPPSSPLATCYLCAAGKFQNKTNGVTQRRWLAFCNPPLRKLITQTLGSDDWITDLSQLEGLRAHADDKEFHKAWRAVKNAAKERAAAKIEALTGVKVSPTALFDVQVRLNHVGHQ